MAGVWLWLGVMGCLAVEISAQYGFYKPRNPCSVVLEEMRFAGYLTRDCTYVDPFVYWRIEHSMSWQGARSACQQIPGGDLVSIHTFNEKHTVNSMAQNNYIDFEDHQNNDDSWVGLNQGVWIGLYRYQNSTSWQWSDESSMDYDDWLTNRPSNQKSTKKEQCAQVVSVTNAQSGHGTVAFGWNDVNCKRGLKALCKVPRVAVFP